MNRKIIIFSLLIAGAFVFSRTNAQVSDLLSSVDYNGQPVIDSDLDGLTDEGENQVYKTDPKNADSDSDGYNDSSEILTGSDPMDSSLIPGSAGKLRVQNIANAVEAETPWPWYISRVSGLVGFILLYFSIFLVLTIRIPFLKKIFAPAIALNAHGWLALQATILALLHGTILVFDKFIGMKLSAIFVPFTSDYEPIFVGLGTVSFYLMVILVSTSYARKHMAYKIWRAIHFLNIILYFAVIAHALYLGTDLRNSDLRAIFIGANAVLILMMLTNMFFRIRQSI